MPVKPTISGLPACPDCGPAAILEIRLNRQTGEQFLGCPNYPQCRYTRPYPTDRQLHDLGAPTLPGLDDLDAEPEST